MNYGAAGAGYLPVALIVHPHQMSHQYLRIRSRFCSKFANLETSQSDASIPKSSPGPSMELGWLARGLARFGWHYLPEILALVETGSRSSFLRVKMTPILITDLAIGFSRAADLPHFLSLRSGLWGDSW